MITASSSKQFLLRIPIGFVPDEIEQKYYPYLSQRFSIYPNLTEYLNAHVQKVNLIPMTARQHITQTDQLHPYGRNLRDAKHPFTFTSGDIVIDKSEIWILRGGFTDRFGQYYAEGLSNGLGCVNVLFI